MGKFYKNDDDVYEMMDILVDFLEIGFGAGFATVVFWLMIN